MVLADESKANRLIRGGEELNVANAEVWDVNIKRSEGIQLVCKGNNL